jgi:hypothetical protein
MQSFLFSCAPSRGTNNKVPGGTLASLNQTIKTLDNRTKFRTLPSHIKRINLGFQLNDKCNNILSSTDH